MNVSMTVDRKGPNAPVSPFLVDPVVRSETPAEGRGTLESPFQGEFAFTDEVVALPYEAGAFAELLHELYDPEFELALYQLAEDAVAAYGDLGATQGESNGAGSDPEVFLREHLRPVRGEAEDLIDRFTAEIEATGAVDMSDSEFDAFLEAFEVGHSELSANADPFVYGLWGKIKKAARKAKKLASKLNPINAVLKKVKRLVRPLLERVLKLAIGKLPPWAQPIATRLAKRFLKEATQRSTIDRDYASAGTENLQSELDDQISALVFSPTDAEGESTVREYETASDSDTSAPFQDLHEARERFVAELAELEDGDEASPAIERFVPAILPALRLGINLAGRPRVVRVMATLLERLISRYVGKSNARPLSRAIVDAGLRLINLEAPNEDEATIGLETLAATVEETVRSITELDESYLDNEQLLELGICEAFEKAVGRNFPPALLKPGIRTLAKHRGVWVPLPRKGPKFYKKLSQPIKRLITPAMARRVPTKGGGTLETFLREEYGIEGEVEVTAHLYEAMLGARPALISRAEQHLPELGEASPAAWTKLHPLIRETAALLFGEAELGSDLEDIDNTNLELGERLMYLEVPGAGSAGRTGRVPHRASQLLLGVELTTTPRIAGQLYLTEVDARAIVGNIPSTAPIAAPIIHLLGRSISEVVDGKRPRQLRIILGDGGLSRDLVMHRYRRVALASGVQSGVRAWLMRALDSHAPLRSQIQTALADARSGVTIIVTGPGTAGFVDLAEALRVPGGTPTSLRPLSFNPPPDSSVRVVPGFEW